MTQLDLNDSQALARYDAFVRQSPYASFYQDRGWAQVKSNWKSAYFIYERDGNIVGAVSALSITAKNGIPFIYCSRAPVMDPYDTELWRQMIEEVRAYAISINAFFARFDPELPEDASLREHFLQLGFKVRSAELPLSDFIQPRCNAVLDLSDKTPEQVLMGFDAKKRYDIRVGLRHDINFTQSREEEALRIFSEMTEKMAERKGISLRDFAYFERLLLAFPQAFIMLGSYEGEAICGALMLPYGDKMTYLYAASSDVQRSLQAPNALLWHLIEDAISKDYTAFDLGGVFAMDSSCPLYKYKKPFVKQEGITSYIGELDLIIDEEVYADFIK